MKTGEGKTFVAVQPLYLNALDGQQRPPGHGQRLPGQARRRVDEAVSGTPLGMRAAFIENMMPLRRAARARTRPTSSYGTNSEFGFDYLRDNMAVTLERRRPARPRLRDRGRGRLDPDRRGAHAADHLRRARDRRAGLLRLRARRARRSSGFAPKAGAAEGRGRGLRRRLRVRREAQDGLADAGRDRGGRARARDRQPLRPAQRAARQPPATRR